jgi:hypothetical protein
MDVVFLHPRYTIIFWGFPVGKSLKLEMRVIDLGSNRYSKHEIICFSRLESVIQSFVGSFFIIIKENSCRIPHPHYLPATKFLL